MELRLCCTNPSIYIADTVCTDISMVQYKTITSIVLAHLLCDILFCTKHWLVICELATHNKFCENIEAVYWKTISIIGVCYTEHGHMLAVITFYDSVMILLIRELMMLVHSRYSAVNLCSALFYVISSCSNVSRYRRTWMCMFCWYTCVFVSVCTQIYYQC